MSEYGEDDSVGSIIVRAMLPSLDICRRAHAARDRRFDGRFVVGVLSTGVFCRPICPARMPRPDNTRYFASPAAALAQGYRPCRRCRPETAPAAPAWSLGSDTALRALRLVEEGFLDHRCIGDLAAAVGVGSRHLRRLFAEEVGVGPAALGRARRLLLAVRLLDDSDLTITNVAMAAGYGSVRRFNAEFRATFGAPPNARRRTRAGRPAPAPLVLRQAFRAPYHADWTFSFLRNRAIPGLESVPGHCYRRRVGTDAWVEARLDGDTLRVSIPAAAVHEAAGLLARMRRLFDLDADPAAIDAHLAPTLAPLVDAARGLRVPGVWDAFEGATRAILGQQVSVQRATVLATTLCERFADGTFPTPAALAHAEVAAIGMPGTRGQAISALARRTLAEGDGWLKDAATLRTGFAEIRGLGPWTAEYAAMRVGRDPDAFPDSDWGVLKTLDCTAAAARRWAEPCRPWRAYATMHLWFSKSS